MTSQAPARPGPTVQPGTGPAKIAPPAPIKGRRRWGLLAGGVVLVVACALVTVWLVSSQSAATQVLVVTKLVPRGQTIAAGDLAAAPVAEGGVLSTVPADQSDQVVGKVATADLLPGTTLSHQSYTEALVPAEGRSMVGVTVDQAHRPATALHAGDVVRVVQAPSTGGDVDDAPLEIAAVIVSTQAIGGTGTPAVTVNLEVADRDAAVMAQMAGSGRATLVIDAPGRTPTARPSAQAEES